MSSPSYADVTAAVMAGEFDADLDALAEVIRTRRKQASQVNAAQLRAGDVFRIGQTVKPKYLAGLRAKVIVPSTSKLTVELLDAGGPRYYRGARFQVPVDLVGQRVEAA